MNFMQLRACDTANGEGIRVSLFVSGCTVRCKGCFNQESWDFNAGQPFTGETLERLLKELSSKYVRGLSILGGDPFEKENIPEVLKIVRAVRERFPQKDIWVWTGRRKERLMEDPLARAVIESIDVLVDGPFVERLKVSGHHWFGSSNQRVIYLKKEPGNA